MEMNDVEDHELDKLRGSAHEALIAASERPETFWYRQQAAIRSRIAMENAPRRPVWHLLLPTSALIALALLLLRPAAVKPVPAAQMDNDDELLIAVEQVMQSQVPDSLAPASLVSEDRSGFTQNSSKEDRNAY